MKKFIFITFLLCQSCARLGQFTVKSTEISSYKIKDKKLGGAKCSRYTEFEFKHEKDKYTIQDVLVTEACLGGYEIDSLSIISTSISLHETKAKIKIRYKNKYDQSRYIKIKVPLQNDTIKIGETVKF